MKKDLTWQEKKKLVARLVAEAISALLEGYGARYKVYIKLKGTIGIYKKGKRKLALYWPVDKDKIQKVKKAEK